MYRSFSKQLNDTINKYFRISNDGKDFYKY